MAVFPSFLILILLTVVVLGGLLIAGIVVALLLAKGRKSTTPSPVPSSDFTSRPAPPSKPAVELTEDARKERRRILKMINEQKISPEEADELLDALAQNSNSRSSTPSGRQCPWCAESIPEDAVICPECRTSLNCRNAGHHGRNHGYRLDGHPLAKVVSIIAIVVSCLGLAHWGLSIVFYLISFTGVQINLPTFNHTPMMLYGHGTTWIMLFVVMGIALAKIVLGLAGGLAYYHQKSVGFVMLLVWCIWNMVFFWFYRGNCRLYMELLNVFISNLEN